MLQHTIKSTGRIAKMVAKRQKRMTGMVVIMIVVFNLAWTPYAFVAILEIFQCDFLPTEVAITSFLLCKTYVTAIQEVISSRYVF